MSYEHNTIAIGGEGVSVRCKGENSGNLMLFHDFLKGSRGFFTTIAGSTFSSNSVR